MRLGVKRYWGQTSIFNNILDRQGYFKTLRSQVLRPDPGVPEIVQAGMDQYKAIVESGNSLDNVKEFIENVNKAVWLYVMTKDERMLDALHGLFGGLLGARQD